MYLRVVFIILFFSLLGCENKKTPVSSKNETYEISLKRALEKESHKAEEEKKKAEEQMKENNTPKLSHDKSCNCQSNDPMCSCLTQEQINQLVRISQ